MGKKKPVGRKRRVLWFPNGTDPSCKTLDVLLNFCTGQAQSPLPDVPTGLSGF